VEKRILKGGVGFFLKQEKSVAKETRKRALSVLQKKNGEFFSGRNLGKREENFG